MASELLLSEQLCDVILKVRHEGFSWRIPAHSLLLVNKSSTFKEDLEGRTEDEAPAPLTITGMQPQTAIAMLKHIYTDKCTEDVTADLLIASDKYDLTELRELLEERVVSDMTLSEACQTFEELQLRQPADDDCNIKEVSKGLLETHALTIFGSDLVFLLGKNTLVKLLESNYLNVPDEAYVFWGIWRWGRRQSSKNNRSLNDADVASYIDDLIVLIRRHSIQNCNGIPIEILARFDRCKTRRTRYAAPVDVLKHSSSLRPCPAWEDFISRKKTDSRMLCIQLSFEKDVMLVGLTLEACESEPNCCGKGIMKTLMCVLRERDSVELRQQKVCWCRTAMRRTSLRGDPEPRLEAEVTLLEPVFLTTGNIYSVYLLGDISMLCFPCGSIPKKRIRVDKTFVNIHGEYATAVRELYVVPDVSVTWGPRGPDV